mmetsp:Transcript_10108/g.36641  ORF Transcript_10108/g.36641 Transcript_10108/m.36641 type:complete len:317 (+) Transcript_10108:535-1485(+)
MSLPILQAHRGRAGDEDAQVLAAQDGFHSRLQRRRDDAAEPGGERLGLVPHGPDDSSRDERAEVRLRVGFGHGLVFVFVSSVVFVRPQRDAFAGVENPRRILRVIPSEVEAAHAVLADVLDHVLVKRRVHGAQVVYRHRVPEQTRAKRGREPQRHRLAVVQRDGGESPERVKIRQVLGRHLAAHRVRVKRHASVVRGEEKAIPVARGGGHDGHPLASYRGALPGFVLEGDVDASGGFGGEPSGAARRPRRRAVHAEVFERRRSVADEVDAVREPGDGDAVGRHRAELPSQHLEDPLPLRVDVQLSQALGERPVAVA